MLRGFLFLGEQIKRLFLQVLLLPCYSNKKAKDSGGGTPDVVGTGFNSLQCLAFSVCCVWVNCRHVSAINQVMAQLRQLNDSHSLDLD